MSEHDKNYRDTQETTPMGGEVPNIDHVHERRDVNTNALLKSLAWLSGVVAAACLILYGFFQFMENRAAASDINPSPVADTTTRPPKPRLQTHPEFDIAELRHREDSLLHSSGWVDSSLGIRRIPIDSAMSIIVARSARALPASNTPADSSGE